MSQSVHPTTVSRVRRAARRLGCEIPSGPSAPRLATRELYAVWETAYRAAGEAIVSEVARDVALEEFGVFGYAALTARTALEGARVSAAHYGWVSGDGRWRVEVDGDRVHLAFERPRASQLGRRVSDEAAVAQFYACLRQAATEPPRVLEVTLREAALAPRALERLFGRRPRRGDRDGIVLDRASLDAACVHAHDGMHAHFLEAVAAVTTGLEPRDWTGRTRRALEEAVAPSELSGEAIAAALGVSFRTLQRNLSRERTTYRVLADAVRCARAEALLAGGMPVERVAEEVGFAEAGAFSRAFHRWRGERPGAYARASARGAELD